jgi:hypothetical protein
MCFYTPLARTPCILNFIFFYMFRSRGLIFRNTIQVWYACMYIYIYHKVQRYSDWLRPGRFGDRILVGARFFAHVQTGHGAHLASFTVGTGSFPGVKRPRRGADHPPLLAPKTRISRAIPLLPL